MIEKQLILRTSEEARTILGGLVREISVVNVVTDDGKKLYPKFVIVVERDDGRLIKFEGDLELANN